MITWANLRSSAALWLALPAMFYAGLYIDDAAYTAPSGYGVESGELAAYGVAIVASAVSGAAAWEAGRHRLLGAARTVGGRSLVQQLFRATTPVLLLHLFLVIGSLVMAHGAVDVWPSGAGLLAVAHLIVLPLGWLTIGWCLGTVLPRSIAAPLAAIGCWAWLSMPHTWSSPWVRHLGGFIDGASTVTDIRKPAVYVVPWLVVAGVALALWLFVHMRRRAWGAAACVLMLAITFVTGRALVADWGYQRPTSPRNVAMTCVGARPSVCVPPEYEQYAEQLRQDALVPLSRLEAVGVTPPRELRISSDAIPLKPGTWPLFWSLPPVQSQPNPAQYAVNLAQSAVVGTAVLAGGPDCRQPSVIASAWAALVIGVDEQSVRQAMLETDWVALQKIRRLPATEQLGWFDEAATSGGHCPRDTA
ncbi:hypothetical protein GCM10022244_10820 [Streptomyces gulbargensis]|uniref:DUF7224 domain-containing protein n=1 Tax=Streptomyces gulbargensis TaxID=364901 RepID=A0ABP7LL01_9ACTN